MDEKTSIQKIVVKTEDELTDIIRDIHKSKAERIILTFADQSDILISPINLKVIEETARREEKLLIAQIIQNPTGVRNSKLANIKVVETPGTPTEDDWNEAIELKTPKKEQKVEEKKEVVKEESSKSSFENRVNNIISNSKEHAPKREVKKESDDIPIINIDGDIGEKKKVEKRTEDLTNRSVENNVVNKPIKPELRTPVKKEEDKKKISLPKVKINDKFKGLLKHSPKLLIPLVGIIILGGLAYYRFVPIVKVRIFVEAKPVEIEKLFTGDSNIENIDFDNLKIPVKEESLEKGMSETIEASGNAFRGEKATGNITLTYSKPECTDADENIILSAGQIVQNSSYSFKLTGSVELTCNSITETTVEAADIGEEYNVSNGKFFTVSGYESSTLYGLNSASFTGGSKEEYTVLSQQDVDNAVEEYSTTAIEEVKSELRLKGDGWDIIENTIKSEVDEESIKTDVPVGSEASDVNIQFTVKGTATYYLTRGLSEGLTDLLRAEANEQDLFESSGDLNLVLGDEIEKELTVEESGDDGTKIKLVASANVKPEVNKEEITNTVSGMKWEEGLNYLADLTFAAQQTEVEFSPTNFPEWLRYFPDKQGGVLITVVDLESK